MQKRSIWRRHSIICGVILILCVLIIFYGATRFYINQQGNIFTEQAGTFEVPINSSNAILTSLEDGEILFEKNSTSKIYPASMTKIMTAIIVLENQDNLNERVLLSKEMYDNIYETNAATAVFLPNEEVSVIDLLYGLLLPSGAECAIGLAEYVKRSESAFVDLMNNKARELGMSNTNFVNSTGLHDARHYSTVSDISKLLRYALGNDTFYNIFTTARHSSKPTNLHSDGITYYSSLFSNMDNPNFDGGSILGGKTGYTNEAGPMPCQPCRDRW